ncbi:MAG: radical SAM protein [Deltaproteobacteria bacterium]|nr:radical SAM protein [Deltaproteobacteria bacterium]
MSQRPVDLLLLNATNLAQTAVYAYGGFVQTSALARQHGLTVERCDLLGVPPSQWELVIAGLLARAPRMVGIHHRNSDVLAIEEYLGGATSTSFLTPPDEPRYLPLVPLRRLMAILRRQTAAPVVVGGIGFSASPLACCRLLEPDFGVCGEPNEFFARFDDVLARRDLASVANLVYRDGDRYVMSPRRFFAPLAEREYDDEVTNELLAFYGGPSAQYGYSAAIEVSRGCPFSCYYCLEPEVEGRAVRERDLEAVRGDLEYLAARGVTSFYMVASELNNLAGAPLLYRLAELFIELNARRPQQPLWWTGYLLPTLERETVELLKRAGYHLDMFMIDSLSDDHLRQMRAPYDARRVVQFLKDVHEVGLLGPANDPALASAKIFYFLGAPFTTAAHVRTALATFDATGLGAVAPAAAVVKATRVFRLGGKLNCAPADSELLLFREDETDPTKAATFAFDESDPDALAWPVYAQPRELVQRLGGWPELVQFFDWAAETFLSSGHEAKRDWSAFLGAHSSRPAVRALLETVLARSEAYGLADFFEDEESEAGRMLKRLVAPLRRGEPEDELELLFTPPAEQRQLVDVVASVVLYVIFATHPEEVHAVQEHLGLPTDEESAPSPWEVCQALYLRYATVEELRDDVARRVGGGPGGVGSFYLEYLLYEKNVVLRPEYRPFFCDE